ncbi:hypothetical protein SAMN05216389_10751 [Oceanobacillus limi]|uniref:Uncharacterized protein n=1 Tax=Oceanobacillus limi TaxID=930131 RepID=A0A1I0CS87_9BACI|nr:hypothetical protein [Oceanobacillus limi]SET22522.1 hypothetical protein SAMN05216389_10751 [Oceanobacillus limi]
MEQKFLSIEELNDLLQQWNGQTIKVTKHEMDDLDQTVLQLQDISYARNTRRIDDYVPMHALHLNGNGNITTDATNSTQDLPASMYEIPLQDDSLYEFDGEKFLISTDRGVYKIEVVE